MSAEATAVTLSDGHCAPAINVGSEGPRPDQIDEPVSRQGVVEWSVRDAAGSEIDALAASVDQVFAGAGGRVTALSLVDGVTRWEQVVDAGELPAIEEEAGSTSIQAIAVGEVVAVAVSETTSIPKNEGAVFEHRTVIASLDPPTGAQRWVSAPIDGGPAPGSWGVPLKVIDDVVSIEVNDGVSDSVWVFDVATGRPRWRANGRLAGGGGGAIFVYRQEQCRLYAIDVVGGKEKWAAATPPQQVRYTKVPVSVAPDGDGVVIASRADGEPLVIARVDASTGADLWRLHLPAPRTIDADVIIDGESVRLLAVQQPADSTTAVQVFDLDRSSGDARWATVIPLTELAGNADLDEILDANPFSRDTHAAVARSSSTVRAFTGAEVYDLSPAEGTLVAMTDIEGSLAPLIDQPGRELVMRSVASQEGIVVSAADTVGFITK